MDQRLIAEISARLENAPVPQALFDFYVKQLQDKGNGQFETRQFTEWEILKAVAPEKYVELVKRQLGGQLPTPSSKIPEDGRGRAANDRLRKLINRFVVSPTGCKLPERLSIPPKKFLLQVRPADPYVKLFWAPYIRLEESEQAPVLIMYTEHLFYYHPDKKYVVRHLEANQEREDVRQWLSFLPKEDGELTPAHHFVNASDVQAVLQLSGLFNDFSIPVKYSQTKAGREQEQLPAGNIIVLGSPRTSRFIEMLQDEFGLNFRLASDEYRIFNRVPMDGENPDYPSEPRSAEALYGVVSRCYSEPLEAWVTMIVSTHGRFFAAMSHYLRDDRGIKDLVNRFQLGPDSPFPSGFEVLFSLVPPRVEKSIMRGYRPTIVAHRVKG